MQGRIKIFKRVYIWRVCTREILIFGRTIGFPRVQQEWSIPEEGIFVLKTVNELIDPISYTWDEELERSLFMQIDAERILRIPLSTQLSDDFVSWHQTNFFNFFVNGSTSLGTRLEGEMDKGRIKLIPSRKLCGA
jgi:hypothetical protein